MPELPDVEGWRRLLDRTLTDHPLRRVEVLDAGLAHGVDPAALVGRVVTAVTRHGKWLSLHLDDGSVLLLHLGMAGSVVEGAPPMRFARIALTAGEVTVTYRDKRRLGGLWWLADAEAAPTVTGPLGPDAAGLSRDGLAEVLRRRRPLKTTLVDQAALAGLGNMLSDELAWSAGIDPRRRSADLSAEEVDALHACLRTILRKANRAGHIPRTRGWLASERAEEAPVCPRCEAALVRVPVGGRQALMCPDCQH